MTDKANKQETQAPEGLAELWGLTGDISFEDTSDVEETSTTEGVEDETVGKEVEENDIEESSKNEEVEEEEENEEESEEEPEEESPEEEVNPFAKVAKQLYDAGIEIDPEKVESEEDFVDSVNQMVIGGVKEWFEDVRDSLPEENFQVVSHIMNGGSLDDIVRPVDTLSTADYNINDEEGAERFLRAYLTKVSGEDEFMVDSRIEFLKDEEKPGDLVEMAKKAFTHHKDVEEKTRQERIKMLEKQRLGQEEAARERTESLRNFLSEYKGYKDIELTARDTRELERYMTRNSVKVKGGGYIPAFHADLRQAFTESPEKMAIIAHLLKNDFDLTSIKKAADTKAAKKVRKVTQTQKKRSPGKTREKGKDLWNTWMNNS